MPDTWLSITINDLKQKPTSECFDYHLLFVKEWNDFVVYHPNYYPVFSNYSSVQIGDFVYNLEENFCIKPNDKNWENPGRWLKVGDIVLNFIHPEDPTDNNYVDPNIFLKCPKILPYRIGQKCTMIGRIFGTEYDEPSDPNLQGYPADFEFVWQTVNIPENPDTINPNDEPENLFLGWRLVYAKTTLCYFNPKRFYGNYPGNGHLWLKIDENRLFINETDNPNNINWYELTISDAI